MQLVASSEEGHLRQLRLNRNKTTVFRHKEDRHRRTTGELEVARRMQSSSQSAWMRTKETCRSVDGIYSNWYVCVLHFIADANWVSYYRRLASQLLLNTRSLLGGDVAL